MQGQALPGFRDFYPEELALRNHTFATWRDVARRYGFQEYDGPPLEPLELYTDKSGAEIVQQLYAFQDKGERKVALRPEMTPTLARMVGATARGTRVPQEALAEGLKKEGFSTKSIDAVFAVAGLRGMADVMQQVALVRAGEGASEPLREAVRALEAMDLGTFVEVDLSIV